MEDEVQSPRSLTRQRLWRCSNCSFKYFSKKTSSVKALRTKMKTKKRWYTPIKKKWEEGQTKTRCREVYIRNNFILFRRHDDDDNNIYKGRHVIKIMFKKSTANCTKLHKIVQNCTKRNMPHRYTHPINDARREKWITLWTDNTKR